MEIFNPNSNIDFLRLRTISIAISIILIVISVGALATRGLNYALDFTGGVLVEASYQKPVEISDVRTTLDAGLPELAGRAERRHERRLDPPADR